MYLEHCTHHGGVLKYSAGEERERCGRVKPVANEKTPSTHDHHERWTRSPGMGGGGRAIPTKTNVPFRGAESIPRRP